MSGYEYGNARLRAMRSRLLTRQEILQMAGASSIAELIGFLSKTPYRRSLEVALIQQSMLDNLYEALHRDFIETICKISRFYEGSERKLVDQVLKRYDIDNLKTILRGISRHASRSEIESTLLPVGITSQTVFSELFRAGSYREAIDILATIGHPFAQPILILRAERPGADLFEMEIALDRWYFQEAARMLKSEQDGTQLVLDALRLDVDISNLLMMLRFVGNPAEQQRLKTRLGKWGLEDILSGPGVLSTEQLTSVYQARNIKSAVDLLGDTPYALTLREGLRAYERTHQLSEIEKSLRQHQLRWLAWKIAKDPLGIGVFLGFLALKTNEIANLRRVARGVQLKQSPEAIRAALEFVE